MWNQSIVPCLVLLFLDLHTDSEEAGEVVWYSHLFKNGNILLQFAVIHTVKGFSIVNEEESESESHLVVSDSL